MSVSSKRSQNFHYSRSPSTPRFVRSSYPSFLSVQESLRLQLRWAWRGLLDAFQWNLVISTVAGDSEIRSNIYKSLLLNSLSLTSIYTFDLLLLPLVRDQQKWLHRNVGWFYQILWLLPVVGVSFYLNVSEIDSQAPKWRSTALPLYYTSIGNTSSWCYIIANRTYTLQRGSRAAAQQQAVTYTGMLTSIATSTYRVVMVFTSVAVSFALGNIPYVGPFVGFIFLCWVDSYYCFEFVWIARGLSLSRRIRHLEERWAYYLAFGLPSAAFCTWGTGLANAAVFALVFPAFIIMAMHARPVPNDPYIPVPLAKSGENEVICHPSPFVPVRLPVFAVVMWLNDSIVRYLSVGGGSGGRDVTSSRNRAFSDPTETMEEGEGLDHKSARRPSKALRPAAGRINVGRPKAD